MATPTPLRSRLGLVIILIPFTSIILSRALACSLFFLSSHISVINEITAPLSCMLSTQWCILGKRDLTFVARRIGTVLGDLLVIILVFLIGGFCVKTWVGEVLTLTGEVLDT